MANLSRRDFIAMTAGMAGVSTSAMIGLPGVPAAAQTPAEPAGSPPSGKRTLRKAVMIGMVGEGASISEKFAILRDLGFEGVEMDCPTTTSRDEILAAQEKTGLKVHGLVDSEHWKFALNNPAETVRVKARAALETCLRDGKFYGSLSVLLVPGLVNADLPYDECYSRSQAEIRTMLPLARECGVKVAVENVWNGFLLSPLEAARYVDELNEPGQEPIVAWHLDIGNIINFGWPEQWVKVLGPRIAKLHIKDFSRTKRDKEGLWKGFDVELGDGDAGWSRVMAALDATGYSTAPGGNWATAEVRGGGQVRLRQIAQQMDRLFAM